MADFARALLARAKAGDIAAARLLLEYAIGKPEAPKDPDTIELDEMWMFLRRPEDGDLVPQRGNGLS